MRTSSTHGRRSLALLGVTYCLAVGLLATVYLVGCEDVDSSSSSSAATAASSTSVAVASSDSTTVMSSISTTSPAVTEALYPSTTIDVTTTPPPTTTEPTLPDLSRLLPSVPDDVYGVSLSSTALALWTGETPYIYLLATKRLVKLPVENDARVGGVAVAGELVVWTEAQYSDDLDAPAQVTLYAYRLPDGPKVKLVGDKRTPSAPLLDGGRVFWVEATHVSGDVNAGEEELYSQVVWMLKVDDSGKPQGSPVKITDRPNSSHEGGGDELWSYDAKGSYLAYQRMWGEEPGVHLVDLGSGTDTYLGEGDIPSVSSSLVVWRSPAGDKGWGIWAYNFETRLVAVLADSGHMPFAGPGYVFYAKNEGDSANDLFLLDEETGSTTLVGEAGQSGGFAFISITGSADYLAWVTITDPRKVHLVAPPALGALAGTVVRDIWEGAQRPPMVAH
jgi:hypothetical protein